MSGEHDQTVVRGVCPHDCPDNCAWEATVSGGRVIKLRGADSHPVTRGQLCPKVNRFIDRVYHPDRLATPLRRTGAKGSGTFEPISWDHAVELIADRLGSVVERSGPEPILQYSFDGTQGVVQKGVMADRFFDALGASDIKRHLCGATTSLGSSDVTGVAFGIDPEELRYAQTIILWGTNTLLTNRHLWATIERAKDNGAVLFVVDPIRTQTASSPLVDHFIQVRPGTDVALVLAMVHVMDRDGLLDEGWLDEHVSQWPALADSAHDMTPEAASVVTGIAAEQIELMAHTFAKNRPSAIRILIGPEHREHGRQIMRAVSMLPSVTGAWRDRGGGLARSTQVYFETALNYPSQRPERPSLNMARLGQVLTNGQQIQALIVHNSNPAVIAPDQNTIVRGLEREDLFTVVIEQFMTDTARYADIVLPATSQLEHLDLLVSWGHLYLGLNQPAIAPVGEALPNTEIFRRLAVAMKLEGPGLDDSDEAMVRQFLDSDHPWLNGIDYDRLVRDGFARLDVPVGHRPYVDTVPDTDDGLLHLGRLQHQAGTETPLGSPELAAKYPLTMMSRKQHMKFLNANYGGFAKHLPREGEPRLEIHLEDASSRGIGEGDTVVVKNDRGKLTLQATISEDVQPGLVTIPFGWWHGGTPDGRGVNALTNATVGDDDAGSSYFHENLVEVTRT